MTTREDGMSPGANALPDGPITGGEALARMLLAHGIGPLFGMGGFQLLPFYDACRRLGLRHALINDERCGAFAADAYARVTGRGRVALQVARPTTVANLKDVAQ